MSSWADLTGSTIAGKYELLCLIGRGGMGAVYEARNTTTLKRCAVKMLLGPELTGDAEIVKRFFREARASGLIESEHVVTAFDSGIDDADRAYYVMECLEGEDLEQALDRIGPLHPVAAAKIALQASIGLSRAHALEIIHRDIKPANLFLAHRADGGVTVKILDFGVAKVKMELFNESAGTLTQSGSLLGTLMYMSPEQLRGASSIDHSADLWSLGVVMFECLTGRLPWAEREGIGDLVTSILSAPVPAVQDWAPWVRPDLAEIVHRTLSRDPERRFRTTDDLREALSRFLGTDVGLRRSDVAGLDENQRSWRAPRLSLDETVMNAPAPLSGGPVVVLPRGPLARRSWRAPLAVLALALGTVAWWAQSRPASLAADAMRSPPPIVSPALPAMTMPAPSVTPAEPRLFVLRVSPPQAKVSVNGASAEVRDGQVSIEGLLGSKKIVRLSLGQRSIEAPVALTDDGLVPSLVVLPASVTAPKPTASVPIVPPPPDTEEPPGPGRISTTFE